jgi:hypothetical protein
MLETVKVVREGGKTVWVFRAWNIWNLAGNGDDNYVTLRCEEVGSSWLDDSVVYKFREPTAYNLVTGEEIQLSSDERDAARKMVEEWAKDDAMGRIEEAYGWRLAEERRKHLEDALRIETERLEGRRP